MSARKTHSAGSDKRRAGAVLPAPARAKIDADALIGRQDRASGRETRKRSLSAQLEKRIGSSKALARRPAKPAVRAPVDARQGVTVKTRQFWHARSGGAALKQHLRYITREAALRDDDMEMLEELNAQAAHNRGAVRDPSFWSCYDAQNDIVDAESAVKAWTRHDRGHLRIVLAAEHGGKLGDLRDFTRAVMARTETSLQTKLSWFAIDHWDTPQPHTHLVLRGARDDGRDLFLSPALTRGLRSTACEIATERLGPRRCDGTRTALLHEARAHRPTQLDPVLSAHLDASGEVRLATLQAPTRDPDLTDALKARARELERLTLAKEVRRNVMRFDPDWRARLRTLERHLALQRALQQERTIDKSRTRSNEQRFAALEPTQAVTQAREQHWRTILREILR